MIEVVMVVGVCYVVLVMGFGVLFKVGLIFGKWYFEI